MYRSLLALIALAACGPRREPEPAGRDEAPASERLDEREERSRLVTYAEFERRPTGVTVSDDGRVFVNFPNWSADHDLSVARVMPGGKLQPFPDPAWNAWSGEASDAPFKFVAVQSLWADDEGGLWILDAGAPNMEQVVKGGPKLVHVNLETDAVDLVYPLDDAATAKSYLNDVRVDLDRRVAYLTDSGNGAIVVLDLRTGKARRALDQHPSTKGDDGYVIEVKGQPLHDAERGGRPFLVHADGLALTDDGEQLYWHPLTGQDLYRIDTDVLADPERSRAEVREAVEHVARTVASDGLAIDEDGRVLHTAIEHDAIVAWDPKDGSLQTVIQDPRLAWPDALSVADDGRIYVTTSRIHEMPRFNGGQDVRTEPFFLFAVPPPRAVSALE